MSYFSDLKNTDLVAFVGASGLSVLAKALEKVFVETDLSASSLSKSLHLKSRCLMAWLEHNQTTTAKIPLTTKITDTLITDNTLAFEKNTAYINSREITKFARRAETVVEIPNYTLPELAAQILSLPQYDDEINSDAPFQAIPELDKAISSLVKRHCEFLQTSQKLQLAKNEGQAICQDCGEYIKVSETGASLCICYKAFKNGSLHMVKNDKGGLTVHFSKSWDRENIALFSRALKNRIG